MRCKPITMADIVGGHTYIAIGISMDGSMGISYPTFYGRPIKDRGSWWIRFKKKQQSSTILEGYRSVADCGLNPTERYNGHRVFKYNSKNHQILAKLVEQQDLTSYFTLIKGTEEESFQLQHQGWNFLFDSMMSAYPDEFDPLDSWRQDD